MALSTPTQNFGIHQVTFKDLTDESIFGTAKILGDATPELTQELIDNRGGSAAFPWASAPGEASGEITLIIKQYDPSILRFINPYISGSNVEDTDGDPLGYTSAITNVTGVSVVDAASGIASIAVDTATAATLAFGDYIIKAVDGTTFNVYLDTDVSGTATYVDDSLKINDSVITNPGTGGTVIFQGVEFTAGSGASVFVADDIAKFSVRPINSYVNTNYLMKDGASAQEFALTIIGEKVGDKIRKITFPRCIASGGANLKFIYKDWSTIEATIKILQPAEEGYVGKQEFINR